MPALNTTVQWSYSRIDQWLERTKTMARSIVVQQDSRLIRPLQCNIYLHCYIGLTPCMIRKACKSLGTWEGRYLAPWSARAPAARQERRGLRAARMRGSAGPVGVKRSVNNLFFMKKTVNCKAGFSNYCSQDTV